MRTTPAQLLFYSQHRLFAMKAASASRLAAFRTDMNPLAIADAGREGVDPPWADRHPIGNAKLSPDPFAQTSK